MHTPRWSRQLRGWTRLLSSKCVASKHYHPPRAPASVAQLNAPGFHPASANKVRRGCGASRNYSNMPPTHTSMRGITHTGDAASHGAHAVIKLEIKEKGLLSTGVPLVWSLSKAMKHTHTKIWAHCSWTVTRPSLSSILSKSTFVYVRHRTRFFANTQYGIPRLLHARTLWDCSWLSPLVCKVWEVGRRTASLCLQRAEQCVRCALIKEL